MYFFSWDSFLGVSISFAVVRKFCVHKKRHLSRRLAKSQIHFVIRHLHGLFDAQKWLKYMSSTQVLYSLILRRSRGARVTHGRERVRDTSDSGPSENRAKVLRTKL